MRCRPRSTPWRPSRAGRSPTRTRTAWSATTGCGRPELAPDAGDRGRDPRHPGPRPGLRRPRARRPGQARRAPSASATCWSSASAARPSGRSSWPTPSAAPATACRPTSSTTPTPTASTACSPGLGERPRRDARRGHLQVGRHAGDAQRHARGGGRVPARAGSTSRAHAVAITQEGSALDRQAARAGLPGALPDVGLGRRPHVGARAPSASCRRRSRGSTSTALLAGAAAMDEATRRRETRGNPAALLALAWHAVGDGTRLEGHGRPALQGPAAPLQPLPAAARHGVARQGEGPRRAASSTRGSPSTATRARRTSTPTCSSCATGRPNFFVTFVRVLRGPAGASLEVEPGATSGDYLARLPARHAARRSSRAAAPSITITIRELTPGEPRRC